MPNGRIQPEFVSRLAEVGTWLGKNGESIYGTRGGPIAPHPWGVTTQKGNRVYVHVLENQDQALLIPALPSKVHAAKLLGTGAAVEYTQTDSGVILKVPQAPDAIDTIVVLELGGKSSPSVLAVQGVRPDGRRSAIGESVRTSNAARLRRSTSRITWPGH